MRIWMLQRTEGKIVRDVTVETADFAGALRMLGETLDCPQPVVLSKHEREWTRHGRTVFLPDDFVESIDFDRLEIDALREPKKTDGGGAPGA